MPAGCDDGVYRVPYFLLVELGELAVKIMSLNVRVGGALLCDSVCIIGAA